MSKEHLLKIIDILYNECISAGGDGDAFWYSRLYKIDDILPLVEEYNSKLRFPFIVAKVSESTIHWYDNQECIIITNAESEYHKAPMWCQFVLKN